MTYRNSGPGGQGHVRYSRLGSENKNHLLHAKLEHWFLRIIAMDLVLEPLKLGQNLLKLKFKKKGLFKLAVPVEVAGVASVAAGSCGGLRWRCRLGFCTGLLLHPCS
jgi:hypothetical protein